MNPDIRREVTRLRRSGWKMADAWRTAAISVRFAELKAEGLLRWRVKMTMSRMTLVTSTLGPTCRLVSVST